MRRGARSARVVMWCLPLRPARTRPKGSRHSEKNLFVLAGPSVLGRAFLISLERYRFNGFGFRGKDAPSAMTARLFYFEQLHVIDLAY